MLICDVDIIKSEGVKSCVARMAGSSVKGQRIDRYRVSSSPRGVGAVSASREFITPAIRLAKSPALQSIDLLNPTRPLAS